MAAKKKQTFEERLDQLEGLVRTMEEGGMTLEDTLEQYEKGIRLAAQLKQDLQAAQERLTVLGDTAEEA